MQYTIIRDLRISKLTLGTVQLGMEYGIANNRGKPDLEKSFEILGESIDSGVNSFDTAELYGDSEMVLGKYFSQKTCLAEQQVLVTKFKIIYEENMNPLNIEKQIFRHMEGSLQRLKLNKIPIYMLHNAKDMNTYGSIIPDTLKKLKMEGMIEKAGVSIYAPEDVDEMQKNDVYEAVQIPMNIMDHRLINSGSLKKLQKENIIVFVRSIFLQGLFFLKPVELTGNLIKAKKLLGQLNKLAEHEGISVAQLALSYVRDMEGVSSLVIGAESPEQVKENTRLMDAPPLTDRTRYEIDRLFLDVPEDIINPRLWDKDKN
ncbi:MAG: aldo/keto reductase [Ruminiclostridium sp.]|nr:aldo/keto reductase [Ruminiclostridium sp.]